MLTFNLGKRQILGGIAVIGPLVPLMPVTRTDLIDSNVLEVRPVIFISLDRRSFGQMNTSEVRLYVRVHSNLVSDIETSLLLSCNVNPWSTRLQIRNKFYF